MAKCVPVLGEMEGAVLPPQAAAAAPAALMMNITRSLCSDPTSGLQHKFYFSESCRGWDVVDVDGLLLSCAGFFFHCPPPPFLGSPRPSPLLASNGLNHLASCQSRGLLWLGHKSASKNRNHLFRLGPVRG